MHYPLVLQWEGKMEYVCYCISPIQLFVTPWTIAHQAPLSMGFSRQEYWSGLPCPSPGGPANPGTEPGSPALIEARFFSIWATKKAGPWKTHTQLTVRNKGRVSFLLSAGLLYSLITDIYTRSFFPVGGWPVHCRTFSSYLASTKQRTISLPASSVSTNYQMSPWKRWRWGGGQNCKRLVTQGTRNENPLHTQAMSITTIDLSGTLNNVKFAYQIEDG